LAGLSVENEYGERVVASGATLVLSGTVVIAGRCANGQHQAEAEQKADNEIREADIWSKSLLFVFHDYSSLNFAGNSFYFIYGHKFTVRASEVQITSAMNKSRVAITAVAKVILDHFVYLANAGCWSSNS